MERMVESDQAATASFQAVDVLATMDAYVACLPAGLQAKLRRALLLFEWCPILFIDRPRPFTLLSRKDVEAYIRTWAESRFGLLRRVFPAIRDLAFLGYYSQPGPQGLIGYWEEEAWEAGDDSPGT